MKFWNSKDFSHAIWERLPQPSRQDVVYRQGRRWLPRSMAQPLFKHETMLATLRYTLKFSRTQYIPTIMGIGNSLVSTRMWLVNESRPDCKTVAISWLSFSTIWFIDSFIICWLRLSFYSLTIRSNLFLLVRLSPTKNPGWIWVPTCPSTLAESQTKSLFEAPNIELELKKMDTKRNWRWYISFCCLLWFDHLPLLFFSFFINDVTICAFFWKICACWIIERQTFRRNILFVQVVPELPPHLTEIGVALITGAENFCPCAWQVGWTGSELNLTHFQIPAVEDVRSKDMAINCTVFKQDPFTIYKKPNVENRRWSRWTWLSCCRSFSIGTQLEMSSVQAMHRSSGVFFCSKSYDFWQKWVVFEWHTVRVQRYWTGRIVVW